MNLKVIAASMLIALAAPALAGPPIMCHPLDIAKAKSLPIGDNPLQANSGYDAVNLVGDTLDILKSESSPLIRMETLRRATVYVTKDTARARDLFSRIMATVLDAQSAKKDKEAAAALFNAGFLAVCFNEMGLDIGWKPGVGEGVQGYGWIKAAIDKTTDPSQRAEMEFAAGLTMIPVMHNQLDTRALYDAHLKSAEDGATEGSLLAANLKAHHARWDSYLKEDSKGKSLADKPHDHK